LLVHRIWRAEGMPILAIARVMGVSRNTVKRALVADGPPRYQRPVRGRSWMRSSRRSASCWGVAVDAGDGGRGADRVAALDPGAA
jgi:transposase